MAGTTAYANMHTHPQAEQADGIRRFVQSAAKRRKPRNEAEVAVMPQFETRPGPQSPGDVRHPMDSNQRRDGPAQVKPDNDPVAKVEAWLAEAELYFDPFAPNTFDAGNDPHLSAYLVGHDDFVAVWGDWISTILAPAGGGKSAFRTRLAYAARVGEDGRRIFPIVYSLPQVSTLEAHLEGLCKSAAYELLLEMIYRPDRFELLDSEARQQVRGILDHNAVGWERFLPQLERAGSHVPLAETFDPAAVRLPNPPKPADVYKVCADLRAMRSTLPRLSVTERWRRLISFLLETLKFEAIYVLVDGVDAYPETAHDLNAALAWLSPLLDQASAWAASRVFLKLFLPIELYDSLWQSYPHLLTFPARFAKIIWNPERLAEVLAARLQVASDDVFDSLDALCTPALRGLNHELAILAHPAVPREVMVLASRLLVEHVRRPEVGDLLEPVDLEAARDWYQFLIRR